MRVVIVTGTILTEQQRLWRACRDRGVAVFLVGANFNSYAGRFPWVEREATDLPCTRLPVLSPVRNRGLLWWWLRGLARTLDEHQPDIVHVLSEPWALPVQQAILALRRRRSRLVVHGCDNTYRFGSTVERAIRSTVTRRALNRIDGFLSWNSAGIACAHRDGLDARTPTGVIPAVIPDETLFHPLDRVSARHRFGLSTDHGIVGFIGRLEGQKGVHDLLATVKLLDERDALLAIWGSGSLVKETTTAVAHDQIGYVFPALPLADVPFAIAACDVIVVPSRTTATWSEQFGRIAVEAMLTGTPVVAYASGALPEVIGASGVLVDEGDVRALATAVDSILSNRSEAEAMARSARADAQARFGAQPLSQRVVEFWTEVLAR